MTQPNIILIITDQQRYDTIKRDGFRVLVVMWEGQPAVVDNPKFG